jgi:electron transport complex protein RnfD
MEPIKEPKPLVLVSSSPHMHCGLTISKSMREVILALVPAGEEQQKPGPVAGPARP